MEDYWDKDIIMEGVREFMHFTVCKLYLNQVLLACGEKSPMMTLMVAKFKFPRQIISKISSSSKIL